MKYQMESEWIKKISCPVVCKIGDSEVDFANGAECADAEFGTSYHVSEIAASDNKIVIILKENASGKMPAYSSDEKWVQQYKKDFGKEPSFFDC